MLEHLNQDSYHQHFIHHIHGTSCNREIVFGVKDDEKISEEHVFLRKGSSPFLRDECLVSDLIRNTQHSITFFGHSIGEPDHTQFKDYFTDFEESKVPLLIFYYGDKDYFAKFKELDTLTEQQLSKFRAKRDTFGMWDIEQMYKNTNLKNAKMKQFQDLVCPTIKSSKILNPRRLSY